MPRRLRFSFPVCASRGNSRTRAALAAEGVREAAPAEVEAAAARRRTLERLVKGRKAQSIAPRLGTFKSRYGWIGHDNIPMAQKGRTTVRIVDQNPEGAQGAVRVRERAAGARRTRAGPQGDAAPAAADGVGARGQGARRARSRRAGLDVRAVTHGRRAEAQAEVQAAGGRGAVEYD